MKKLVAIILFILPLLSAGTVDRPSHEIRSMMIYNFIKYIQWPVPPEKIVIGVMGDEEVYNSLYEWYNGQLRGKKEFVIKKCSSVNEVNGCNVVYVGTAATDNFDALKETLSQSPTLLITNEPGMGQKGSAINFVRKKDRQLFELNKKVIEQANLKVSNKLTGLAILI